MRLVRWMSIITIALAANLLGAPQRGAADPGIGQRGGRGGGGGRGGITTLNVISTSWPDGGQIPNVYTQAGLERSPGVQWSGAPAGILRFVVIFYDFEAASGDGIDDTVQWLVRNITGQVNRVLPG